MSIDFRKGWWWIGDDKALKEHKVDTKSLFDAGLKDYHEGRFKQAIANFKKLIELNSDDTVAQFFLEKSNEFLETGVTEDWTGVENMTSK